MSKHRCEAKGNALVRAFGKPGKGYLNRNSRCPSTDTVRHIRNPQCDLWAAWDRALPGLATEAWYCGDHAHDQQRGVTQWAVAP